MILTKEVKVNVNNKNIKHFKSQNLDVKYGESYDIEVEYLPRYSKYRVVAQCESCGFLQELSLQKYHQNWERSNSYNCKNNLLFERDISKIENLCMTKRKINSSKSHNIESDFITKKDQL